MIVLCPEDPQKVGTTISYRLTRDAAVKAAVVNAESGRRVWMAGEIPAGKPGGTKGANTLAWDGRDEQGQPVSSGKYTVVLLASAGEDSDKKTIVIESVSPSEALAGGPFDSLRSLRAAGAGAGGSAAAPAGGGVGSGGVAGGGPFDSPGSLRAPGGGTDAGTGGTHDNGMGNGANPKDFNRGSNPGNHGEK